MNYDYLIIGGGIFGIYAALHLSKKKKKVCLVEKDKTLFSRASVVNQARLHGGYHYPRSIATARTSHVHKKRFMLEHQSMVNHQFQQYYGIDKYASYTNADQFEAFCAFLKIPLKKVKYSNLFNMDQIEALYQVEEYSFDPYLLAKYYRAKIAACPHIEVKLKTTVESVSRSIEHWDIRIYDAINDLRSSIKTASVINATYSSINAINQLFGLELIDMTHEIAEVVFARAPFNDVGLTIIDGDFASFMPFGLSDLISLSSVRYTCHQNFEGFKPTFSCQKKRRECTPDDCRSCNSCFAQPPSNQVKMIHQIKKYLGDGIDIQYIYSKFTIKSKLKSSYIDDSRPTLIQKLFKSPEYYCIFGGKFNSIYDIESHFYV